MNTRSERFLDFLCRTCMQELAETSSDVGNTKPEPQWESIFGTIGESASLHIAELLSSAVPQIEVQLSDELPKKICHKCLEQLQSIHKFQQMCVQSQQQMLQLICKMNADLKMTIQNSKQKQKIHECHLDKEKEQRIEFASVETLPDAMLSTVAADPLQSINEIKVENCEDTEADFSIYVINELCDDNEPNVEQSYGETLLSAVTIKNEEVEAEAEIETGGEGKSLPSSSNICPLCNKNFGEARLLKRHLKRHKKWEEKNINPTPKQKKDYVRVKCTICDRYFYNMQSLKKHSLRHDSEAKKRSSFNCDVCNKTLSSRRTLDWHKINYHSDNKEAFKRYKCEFCDKAFLLKAELTLHLRTHTGERPYLCPECGKAFTGPGFLREHRLRHDVKRIECPDCPRKFHCSGDLQKHKLAHEQNKRHVCDVCGASFIKAHPLKVHKLYHTGEKPFKCDKCDKRFVLADHMRRHMRTHTGEKPYKCKYCERAFAQSNDHIKHLRSHIGENVYRCEMCPSAFRLLSELRLHFPTHKNDNQETRERNMKALKEAEAELQLKLGLVNATSTTEVADG